MSLWEFSAALGGYAKANRVDGEHVLTTDEAAALAASLDQPPVWH